MSEILFEMSVGEGFHPAELLHDTVRWLREHHVTAGCVRAWVTADDPTVGHAEVLMYDEWDKPLFDGNRVRTQIVKFPIGWYPT